MVGASISTTRFRTRSTSRRLRRRTGGGGSLIQDSFNPSASRASSDFDIRHNITANTVVELPFGRSKHYLSNANALVDGLAGGWQISMLSRLRSGRPLNITNGGLYPTNYLTSALAILRPGATMPETGTGFNQNGQPSIFRNTADVSAFMGQYPGTVGTRNMVRGPGLKNFDLSAAKTFRLPFEGHRIQFRAEAFNAFNNVNFSDASADITLSLNTPGNFGQLSRTEDARVMQFALRYEF